MIDTLPPHPLFCERLGIHVFREPSSVWGYLPQLQEFASKGNKDLNWQVDKTADGEWKAIPVCEYYLYLEHWTLKI